MVKCRSEIEKRGILQRFKELYFKDGLDSFLITNPINRRYLSAFTGSSGVLLLTKDNSYLITDFRYIEQAEEQAIGFDVVKHEGDVVDTVNMIIEKDRITSLGLEKDYITLADYEIFDERISGINLVPVSDLCVELRRVKTKDEITQLKKAIEISDKAFLHILDNIRPGQTEKDVSFELELFMKRLGAEKLAFDTIVASGWRSALPHGVASEKVINVGDMVTLDFGAVYKGYHSDMTRTIFMGKPNEQQQQIYNLVLWAQQKTIGCIATGMRACEADEIARNIIGEAGFKENFGHGLGHGVGLEIHEWPRLSPRDGTILEPGMIVSVEPGIYINGWGGVRIEDLILITTNGCEVLTQSPKTINEMIIDNL